MRRSSQPLLDRLADTGCSRVALPFDVDTIDGSEIVLGLGHPEGGLTSVQVRRTVTDVASDADIVALTIAEFFADRSCTCSNSYRAFPYSRSAEMCLRRTHGHGQMSEWTSAARGRGRGSAVRAVA